MTSKDKLLKKIFGALEGVDIKQSKFVSKINNQKEIKPEDTMPFPSRNVHENKINYGKGLDYIYGTKPLSNQADYPEGLNPFASALQKIKPSAEKLSWLKSAVVRAKSPNELHKVVDEALAAGARLNACNDGEWSFAEYVVLGTHFHKFDKVDRKKVIRKLMLSGAEFHDTLLQNKLIGEIYNELQPEVQPQIDERLEELEKAGESAVQEGELIDIEIDNTTSYIEFSEDSKVEVAKILEANRKLGSNILKIGNDAVEVKSEKGGIRNYTDISDGSSIMLEFPTSIGKLNIILYHDVKKYDQVQVRVENKEMWAELQQRGEEIGKNCLFAGVKLKEAVEKGSFMRCGIWNSKQLMKEVDSPSEKLFSWADKVRENSKETCRAL
ncbi:hypothetical protein [Wolbachia endosymbiont of Tribolium confusum]|uniref:hypothetical protein n=1 Tax=Wolbachia endosymbiont of Tribolium confusum TaxID=214474 RepID=UPI001CF14E11|nr:hypothetical protein [Wolbachia endosymbiont of Tribolium confusum]MCA7010958.1 hypothetical protein [Wolbachia endosymbiont of Tribolium confusum]